MLSKFNFHGLLFISVFLSFSMTSSAQELKGESIRGDRNLPPVPKREWETPDQKVGAIVTRIRPSIHKSGVVPYDAGILHGKTVYLSPGHGWYWTGSTWTTQRGLSEGVIEDLSNAESVDQFLVSCLWRAGANIVPVREIDTNANMAVIDNDTPSSSGGDYSEEGDPSLFSTSSVSAFSIPGTISDQTNPFSLGTNRLMDTSQTETARFVYVFDVPASGYYNVYISYTSWSQRAPDAHYIVYHPGGQTHFRVDQRYHGKTWVLLGRFWFKEGKDRNIGAVVIANDSQYAGTDIQVSADAVRIGGGMGLISRGGSTSGYPRWEECCRYQAQYAGAPSTVYNSSSSDDHIDDISCRSRLAAWIHETGEDSVYFSWHSNAGGGTGTSTYVYGPNPPDGTYNFTGVAGSDILGGYIQDNVVDMFRHYYDSGWRDRGLFSAYFGELNPSYNNEMPAALMEVLFHDNASDMAYYHQPEVRYRAAREVCRSIIHYFAQKDGITPVYPPLAPTGLKVTNNGPGKITLSWNPPPDDPKGDAPDAYRVYFGLYATAFNEGTLVNSTTYEINNLSAGQTLYFKVSAVNDGGESISTPPVSVRISPSGYANVLIIDAFTKMDSELAWMQNGNIHRMDLKKMNNFRTGIQYHAPELAGTNAYFDMLQLESFASGVPDLSNYEMIDLMVGRGSAFYPQELWDALNMYVSAGGKLFVSGNGIPDLMIDSGHSTLLSLLGIDSVSQIEDYNVSFSDLFSEVASISLSHGNPDEDNFDAGHNDALTSSNSTQAAYGSGSEAGVATSNHDVIYFGFPFEGINEPTARQAIMTEIVDNIFEVHAIDAGVDTDEDTPDFDTDDEGDHIDPSEDSNDINGNDSDTNMNCKTETVYGCHCSSSNPAKMPVLIPFLTFLGLLVLRKRNQGK